MDRSSRGGSGRWKFTLGAAAVAGTVVAAVTIWPTQAAPPAPDEPGASAAARTIPVASAAEPAGQPTGR